jgi:hypothetical protein
VGTLKALVYSAPTNDLEVTSRKCLLGDSSETGNFRQSATSVRRRAESCVEMHGNHTKHPL